MDISMDIHIHGNPGNIIIMDASKILLFYIHCKIDHNAIVNLGTTELIHTNKTKNDEVIFMFKLKMPPNFKNRLPGYC